MADNETRLFSKSTQEQINKDAGIFFEAYKSLLNFDARDEKRISKLLQNRDLLDQIVVKFIRELAVDTPYQEGSEETRFVLSE